LKQLLATTKHDTDALVAVVARLQHKDIAREQRLADAEARCAQLQSTYESYSESLLNEICKHTETQAKLAAAEDALQALYDFQNGCPLPSYRVGWMAAMVAAENVLAAADSRLLEQIAAKEVCDE
jgi:hypothetical protein